MIIIVIGNKKPKVKISPQGIKASLLRLFRMILKEFKLLKTDPFNLLIAIVIPPLIIIGFGFMSIASSSNPIPTSCVVVSFDSNTFINPINISQQIILDDYSIPYVNAVNKSGSLDLVQFFNATEEIYAMETARTMLLRKQIKIIIVIPSSFSEMLNWGYPGLLECVPDASDIAKIQEYLNGVQDSVNIFINDTKLTPQFLLQGFEEFAIPPDYNFEFNTYSFMILPIMTFGVALVLSILIVVKEKPIARLLLTPVQKAEILVAKYLSYSIILIIQVSLLIIASLSMGLYLAGTIFDLFLALFILGFTGLAFGLFISTLSNTKTEANQLFFAFFIVIVLLSGIFVPIESMPGYLQVVAYMLPLSHGSPMITGIVTKGHSILGTHFLWMLGISVVLFMLSFIIFMKKRYEV